MSLEDPVNKADFIKKVSTKLKLKQSEVEKVLNTAFSEIKTSVKKGESVKLSGFGTFEKQKHKPRNAKNPQTGKCFIVGSKWHPKFRPSSDFKNLIS